MKHETLLVLQKNLQMKSYWLKLFIYLYCLAGMAAVVGEDGRDGLQDFASVSPGDHEAEEAGTGQSSDGLSCWVIWPCAPDRGLQQQLEKRFWDSTQWGGGGVGGAGETIVMRTLTEKPHHVTEHLPLTSSQSSFMWYRVFIHTGVSSLCSTRSVY